MANYLHYTYRTTWLDADQQFVGLCAEFPSLSWIEGTPTKAHAGIIKLVEDVVADMEEMGEIIPEPLSHKHFSGKFQVRIPPESHRNLAIDAAEKGISMNRLVSLKLA